MTRKRRGRLFIAMERAALGIGMSVVAVVIERRLLKAIQQGGFKPKPPAEAPNEGPREAQLA